MQTNRKSYAKTFEGAVVRRTSDEERLRRSVLSCYLFEDTFYEDGEDIADRIDSLVQKVPQYAAELAIEARHKHGIRHAPLWILNSIFKHRLYNKLFVPAKDVVKSVINRPDEITELVAMYWKDGKKPLPAQLKKGLAASFTKFDAYRLAKYNTNKDVTLRDVMFLVRPKPVNDEQAETFKLLANNRLPSPDTWEANLTSGAEKASTFIRLMDEGKLGVMATIRNLRLMTKSGVDRRIIAGYLDSLKPGLTMPYRFAVAAVINPGFETQLDRLMLESCDNIAPLDGTTIILVDVSGSMVSYLSSKSCVKRRDAAGALAAIAREVCDDARIFAFGSVAKEVPARRGIALADAIIGEECGFGTMIGSAYDTACEKVGHHDRVIVITDGQSHDHLGDPRCDKAYMMNVATHEYGVGYGEWTVINGFSSAIFEWINMFEEGK